MDRKDVFEYVKKQYGTVPEYLWKESPESAVLRHKNGKWYAVLMQVKKSKIFASLTVPSISIVIQCSLFI